MSGTASTAGDIISVGRPLPRIAAVTADERRRVQVTWRNGKMSTVDLAPVILSHRVFIPLRNDDDLFQTVRVNTDGTALEWDEGIELSAEWIERLPSIGMDNAEFRRIMDTLDLTLDGMAAQLEVSRRLIAQFRGVRPIPSSIALATRYLVEHHDMTKQPSDA